MAAPVSPAAPAFQQLNGIDGAKSATFRREGNVTVARLIKEESGKEYAVTITFPTPMDETTLRSYLNMKETRDKIDLMIKQFEFFTNAYGKKGHFHIESFGNETCLFYDRKHGGGFRKLNISDEEEFNKTRYYRAEDYQRKIKEADDKGNSALAAKWRKKKEDFLRMMDDAKSKQLARAILAPQTPDPKKINPAFKVGAPPAAAPVI